MTLDQLRDQLREISEQYGNVDVKVKGEYDHLAIVGVTSKVKIAGRCDTCSHHHEETYALIEVLQ